MSHALLIRVKVVMKKLWRFPRFWELCWKGKAVRRGTPPTWGGLTGAISRCTLPSLSTLWFFWYLSPWIALHRLLTAEVRDRRGSSVPESVKRERERERADENDKYQSLAACGSKPKPGSLSIIGNRCLWKSPKPNGRAHDGAGSPLLKP